MWVAAWMMERACSRRSARGASGRHSSRLGVAEDAGQGRAEVVGHDVHELALHAVQLHELRVRPLEGLVELGVAQDDADPVRQRLQGDDLALGVRPAGVSRSTSRTATTSSPQRMGTATLAARRRDEADVVGVGGHVGDVRVFFSPVAAPDDPPFMAKRPLSDRVVACATAAMRYPLASGSGHADGDDRVLEGLVDPVDRRLQDALALRGSRDLAHDRVDDGELLAPLPLRAAKAIEFATAIESWPAEAREVLEVFAGRRAARPVSGGVEHAEQRRLVLLR